MPTLKETATNYEAKQTRNISELEEVSVNINTQEKTFTDKQGDEFTITITEIDGVEYRIPNSVIQQLQEVLKKRPDLKTFSVSKKGEGLSTSYTVVALE